MRAIDGPREKEVIHKEPKTVYHRTIWRNVGFFKKNGYLLRGELRDVPKGHDCYELYKNI